MDLPEDMRRKNKSIIDTTNRQMIVRQQNVLEKKVKKKKRESKIERSEEKAYSEISNEAIDQKRSQTTSKKSLFKDKKG